MGSLSYRECAHDQFIRRLDLAAALPPDPRMAGALTRVLVSGRLGDELLYNRCCSLLIVIGDRRQIPRLEQLLDVPRAKTIRDREALRSQLPLVVEALSALSEIDTPSASVWRSLLPSELVFCDEERINAEALLDRILCDPDDYDLRHVYADALLEIGDPRGEFIALQLSEIRTAEASKRMRVLEREYREDWLGPDLSRVFASVRFRDGFPSIGTLAKNSAAEQEVWQRAYSDPRLATFEKIHKGQCNRMHHGAFLDSEAAKNLER